MKSSPIAPVLVGRGMAGQAILKSLSIVSQTDPELELLPVRTAARGAPLSSYISDQAMNVLFLANPSGLHAKCIVEGDQAAFRCIASDKPVCVRREELSLLRNIKTPVTVFHGYRVMWGTRIIKAMLEAGDLGELLCFESRYWQSSSAQRALKSDPEKRMWKSDPELNGPFDVLTDLGSHVMDLCLYLMPERPLECKCWLSYWNSDAPFRDTHVHLALTFSKNRRALASISKTVHGATNNFEYTVMGTRGTATWRFLQPD
jgi:predicted dehydrogenase